MRPVTLKVRELEIRLRVGNDEYMPVEECGNMIFMTLAFSQFTHNVEYLKKHYKILKQWTSYLIDFGLIPATQGNTTDVRGLIIVSTDDFAGPLANQTNLALKAILGIRAMGEIASLTKNDKDAKEFIKTSEDYMQKWEKYTFEENSTHAKLAYQMNSSWGILPRCHRLQEAHFTMHTRMTCWAWGYFQITSGASRTYGTTREPVTIHSPPTLICREIRTSTRLATYVYQKRLGNVHRRDLKDTDEELTHRSLSIMDQRNVDWSSSQQSHNSNI
jgi:hypothetical protein